MGCAGKWAIHPSQIEIANDVFAPSKHEIDEGPARWCEGYQRGGGRAVKVPGTWVVSWSTRPPCVMYEAVLERAKLTGRV